METVMRTVDVIAETSRYATRQEVFVYVAVV